MTQKAKKVASRKKKAPHRPRKRISSKQVEELARVMCTQEEMAAVLGVSRHTIIRRIQEGGAFATAYKKGQAEAKLSLRRLQWVTAKGKEPVEAVKNDQGDIVVPGKPGAAPSPTMQIWLGKQPNWLGQTDRQDIVTHTQVEEFSDAYIEAGRNLVEGVASGSTLEEVLKMFETEVRAISGKVETSHDDRPN